MVKRAKVKFKNFCWDALMKMDESDVLEGLAADPDRASTNRISAGAHTVEPQLLLLGLLQPGSPWV